MFKQMFSVAFIPVEWKMAVIIPFHKKGPTEQVSNYRPISITCVPCKLLERIIVNQIYRHLNDKSSAVAEMGDRGHNRHGPKRGRGAVPLSWSAGNPSNTMWPARRSTSVPSGVFIHPAVWPQ